MRCITDALSGIVYPSVHCLQCKLDHHSCMAFSQQDSIIFLSHIFLLGELGEQEYSWVWRETLCLMLCDVFWARCPLFQTCAYQLIYPCWPISSLCCFLLEHPILEGGRELPRDWYLFLIFSDPIGSSFYCSSQSHWPPLSTEQELVCLYPIHFSPQSLLWHFWSISYQISPWFLILLTSIFIVLRSFWPLLFTEPQIQLG